MKKETEIEQTIFDKENKIIAMYAKKIVKKYGNSGHIILHNSLIGKEIYIRYNDKKEEQ